MFNCQNVARLAKRFGQAAKTVLHSEKQCSHHSEVREVKSKICCAAVALASSRI